MTLAYDFHTLEHLVLRSELHAVTLGVSEQSQLFHFLHFKKSYGLYYQDVFSAQNPTTVGGKAPWRSLVLSWDYIQH